MPAALADRDQRHLRATGDPRQEGSRANCQNVRASGGRAAARVGALPSPAAAGASSCACERPYGRIRVRPGGFGRNDRLRLLCLVGTWDLPRRGVCSPARRSWPSHAAGSTLRPWVSRPEIIPVPRPSFVSSDFSLRAFTRSYLFCFP